MQKERGGAKIAGASALSSAGVTPITSELYAGSEVPRKPQVTYHQGPNFLGNLEPRTQQISMGNCSTHLS